MDPSRHHFATTRPPPGHREQETYAYAFRSGCEFFEGARGSIAPHSRTLDPHPRHAVCEGLIMVPGPARLLVRLKHSVLVYRGLSFFAAALICLRRLGSRHAPKKTASAA